MNRYLSFVVSFLLSLLIFLIFRNSRLVDTIVMAAFIISTLMFVFRMEEKPKNDVVMKIPQVHYYQKERQNIYGYFMVCGAVSCSFLFYVASTREVRLGFISLCLWLFLIILASVASVYANKSFHKDAIEDYLSSNIKYNFSDIDFDLLINSLLNTQSFEIDVLQGVLKNFNIEKEIENQIIEKYVEYVRNNFIVEDELTSDEMEEINSRF